MASLVEAGTSGFLSISDSDRRVPEELGQEGNFCLCELASLARALSRKPSWGFPSLDRALDTVRGRAGNSAPQALQTQ